MASPTVRCSVCGAPLPAGAWVCPSCRTPVVTAAHREPDPGRSAAARGAGRPSPRGSENPFAAELNRRLARLAQWAEAADPLGVEVPRVPLWAEEAAARARNPEPWAEVVRGVERLAQRRITEAFEKWEATTTSRIARLEAYSVDSRLERSQVEDVVHAARVGDVAQALATFQQVDRVVTLKERHLDQARAELERLLGFLRDLEVLGLVDPGEPAEVAEELERELRTGHLASLKQRLRLLRSRAGAQVAESAAGFVAQLGDQLAAERRSTAGAEADTRELAVATRAIALGHAEEGAHRLRQLKEARGLSVRRPAAASARGRSTGAT